MVFLAKLAVGRLEDGVIDAVERENRLLVTFLFLAAIAVQTRVRKAVLSFVFV